MRDDDDDVYTRGARCAVCVESARGDGDGDGGAPIETIGASSAVDFIVVDVKVLRIASGATHDDAHERTSGASGAHRVALRLAGAHGGGDRTGVLGVHQSNLLV